ncbi:MAG: ABC transporter permease [Clostridiales bacterium]|nr:ABC transporter permease [Clostridiales bacterium]
MFTIFMFTIFMFTIKNNFKAFWIPLSIIATTLIVIFLLGSILENMQKTGVNSKERVGIINEMNHPYKDEFDKMFEGNELKKILEITCLNENEDVQLLLEEGKFHTIIEAYYLDGKNSINVSTVYPESYVLAIATNFTQTANTVTMVMQNQGDMNTLEKQYNNKILKTKILEKGNPIGLDYYGVVSMLQMIAILGIIAVYAILDDKTKNIFPRIKTAPISNFNIIAGRTIANVLYITFILVVIATLASLILGVNWNGNYLVILTVFILFSFIITLLGMISAQLTKSVTASLGVIMGIGSVLWPKYSGAFSPFIKSTIMSYVSPNFHAKNVLFATIYGGSTKTIFEGLVFLFIIAIVMMSIFTIIERSKINDSI